jgi:hypothetical protein
MLNQAFKLKQFAYSLPGPDPPPAAAADEF